MRLAFISLHTSPLAEPGRADAGGMNVVVSRAARELARLGHDVDLYTRRSDPATPRITEVDERLRLITLDAGAPAPLPKSEMEQAIAPFSAALDEAIGEVDLIHSHHWFSGVAALPVARRLRIPHVQSYHSVAAPADAASLALGEQSESPGRIAGERAIAQGSDLVVAVSQVEADTIIERYGIDPSRVRIARPGVGVEFFTPRTCPPPEHPYLLFAARLQPLKGADLALQAFAGIDDAELRLLLAGDASDDFGDYPATLRTLAADLGIADRVEFVGACTRDRLACLMREATLFLLPSWSETFGLVALESQASGVPVVGWSGAGGLKEAVADTGLLLDTRDPAVWAETINRFLADDAWQAAASAASRDFACAHTWRHTANALLAAYEEVLP